MIVYGTLEINRTSPTGSQKAVFQNNTFDLNATISCVGEAGAICGTVYAYALYNDSSANPDTHVNTSEGASPFYILSSGGGDMEFVLHNSSVVFLYDYNDSSESYVSVANLTSATYDQNIAKVKVGDVTNDNNSDIVVLYLDSNWKIDVWSYNGADWYKNVTAYDTGETSMANLFRGVFIGDTDNDGINDNLLTMYLGTAQDARIHDYTPSTFEINTTGLIGASYDSLYIGDVDGDTNNEIIFGNGNSDRKLIIYEYVGGVYTNTFNVSANTSASTSIFDDLDGGDMDGDGDEEILGCGGTKRIEVFKYESGSYSQIYTSEQFGNLSQSCDMGDYDGDGNAEIMTGFRLGQVQVYELVEGEIIKVWEGQTNPSVTGNMEPASMASGDMDGDGKDEIVMAFRNSTGAESPLIFIFKNNGTNSYEQIDFFFLPASGTISLVTGIDVGDIDNNPGASGGAGGESGDNPMSQVLTVGGENLTLNWIVNVTGANNTNYEMAVFVNSSAGSDTVPGNSSNFTLCIGASCEAPGDSDFPQFTDFAVNDTLLGNNEVAKFNLSITDASASVDYVNATINGTTYDLTQGAGDEWHYNFTCTSSDSEVNLTYVGANDTNGNWNSTTISTIGLECDAAAPSISSASINESSNVSLITIVNVNASVIDTEGNIDDVVLEVIHTNASAYNFSSIDVSGNVYYNDTVILDEAGTWVFRFYANDTAENDATSVLAQDLASNYYINVTPLPATYGDLHVLLVSPTGGPNNQPQNQTFLLKANVTCSGDPGDVCGEVNGTVRYNASSANPDTDVQGDDLPAIPFYIEESNPLSCGNMVVGDDACNLTFTVNATGAVLSLYKLDVNFTSNESSIETNATDSTTIKIISSVLSLILSNDLANVQFPSLVPATTNNDAQNNSDNSYNITCFHPGANCNISIKGNSNFINGLNSIGIGNASWNNEDDDSTENNFSLSYKIINATLPNSLAQLIYFWVDLPSGVVAGDYKGNFTIYGESN